MSFEFNALIPELSVQNFQRSLDFYTDVLGFSIQYQRPEDGFAFLVMGMAQIMIDEIGKGRTWKSAEFEYPLGRGINFQIEVESIDTILNRLADNNTSLFMSPEEKWYRVDDHEEGNRQFIVQDPDGYLLRFTEDIGSR